MVLSVRFTHALHLCIISDERMVATAVKMNNALILENRVNLIFYILYEEINFLLSIVWQAVSFIYIRIRRSRSTMNYFTSSEC